MIFGAILFALCIGLVVYCNLILSGARKIADEAHAKTERAKEEIKMLEEKLEVAACCIPNDYPLSFHIGLNDGRGNVFVYAEYQTMGEDLMTVCIKSFPDEDIDFALLEAQELLDHLNEK